MDWTQVEIIGVVVIGIGVIYSAMRPFFSVNSSMTELKNDMKWVIDSIKDLKGIFVDYDLKNEKEHNQIFEQLRNHHDRLNHLEIENKFINYSDGKDK